MAHRKPEGYLGGKPLSPETLMLGYGYKPSLSEGAVKCPIFQTSTFAFKTAEDGKAFFELALGLREKKPKEEIGLIYSRLNNPDLEILEDRLCLWDNAEAAQVFASGMAAISTTVLAHLEPGDVVLHSEPVYGGTDYFFKHILPRFGIKTAGFLAGTGIEEMQRALSRSGSPKRLGMVFIETPCNPTNELVDIEACAEFARHHSKKDRRVPLVVDNTFLGPVFQHPILHGADLVIYSATKFIGGHSDVIAGVCLGSKEMIAPVVTYRTFLGTHAGPWTGWLLLRSLETLKLRMTCMAENARQVADYLTNHPKVERVSYLGHLTEESRQFKIFRKQCLSPGSMIAFDVKGGESEAFRFLNALKLFKLAVSLGGTESLAEHPGSMTHAELCPKDRARMGITEKMLRLSIGVENPSDLIADLGQALKKT